MPSANKDVYERRDRDRKKSRGLCERNSYVAMHGSAKEITRNNGQYIGQNTVDANRENSLASCQRGQMTLMGT